MPRLSAFAGLECIQGIELPRYSFIARRTPSGGTVRAVVKVGNDGKAASIRTPGADDNLAEEVRDTLTDGTSYVQSCKGLEFEIVFTFRLEGEATPRPLVWIKFESPNHFTIISEPKQPHYGYYEVPKE
jgi:hypothetical protein